LAEAENRLIESLPRKDRLGLLCICTRVELILADVLADPDTPMRDACFPTEGSISLVANVQGSPGAEVGVIGFEGVLGAHFALCVSLRDCMRSFRDPSWRGESTRVACSRQSSAHSSQHVD
jgi:hypothetical protein